MSESSDLIRGRLDLLCLILRQGLICSVAGAATGFTRVLGSLLYDVKATDQVTSRAPRCRSDALATLGVRL